MAAKITDAARWGLSVVTFRTNNGTMYAFSYSYEDIIGYLTLIQFDFNTRKTVFIENYLLILDLLNHFLNVS